MIQDFLEVLLMKVSTNNTWQFHLDLIKLRVKKCKTTKETSSHKKFVNKEKKIADDVYIMFVVMKLPPCLRQTCLDFHSYWKTLYKIKKHILSS